MNILDKNDRECLAIRVKRKLNLTEVTDALTGLLILRGVPAYIRSDNGPEFIADAVRNWIKAFGSKITYIEPGSPLEKDYFESFNGWIRDELLNGEIFYSLGEAQIVIEKWKNHYNTKRPHSALRNRPPAPKAIVPMYQRSIMRKHSNWSNQVGLLIETLTLAENCVRLNLSSKKHSGQLRNLMF